MPVVSWRREPAGFTRCVTVAALTAFPNPPRRSVILHVAKHAAEQHKTFAMNLAAPFIMQAREESVSRAPGLLTSAGDRALLRLLA